MVKEAIYDNRVNEILVGMAEGKSREELADELGYKDYKGIDMHMRRRNFRWNTEKQRYEPFAKMMATDFHGQTTGKVGEILSLLENGLDPRTVAKNVGLKDHRSLATYMRDRGYRWDSSVNNYIPERGKVRQTATNGEPENARKILRTDQRGVKLSFKDYEPILKMLYANQDKLRAILMVDRSMQTLPRYKLPGTKVTKSVQTVTSVDALVKEYSKQYNVSQKEIYEVALVEFFKKYGFEHEIEALLSN